MIVLSFVSAVRKDHTDPHIFFYIFYYNTNLPACKHLFIDFSKKTLPENTLRQHAGIDENGVVMV